MSIGFWQIAIVVVLVVLLFGRGKISALMGDVAKGIKVSKRECQTALKQIAKTLTIKTIQQKVNFDATNRLV